MRANGDEAAAEPLLTERSTFLERAAAEPLQTGRLAHGRRKENVRKKITD